MQNLFLRLLLKFLKFDRKLLQTFSDSTKQCVFYRDQNKPIPSGHEDVLQGKTPFRIPLRIAMRSRKGLSDRQSIIRKSSNNKLLQFVGCLETWPASKSTHNLFKIKIPRMRKKKRMTPQFKNLKMYSSRILVQLNSILTVFFPPPTMSNCVMAVLLDKCAPSRRRLARKTTTTK